MLETRLATAGRRGHTDTTASITLKDGHGTRAQTCPLEVVESGFQATDHSLRPTTLGSDRQTRPTPSTTVRTLTGNTERSLSATLRMIRTAASPIARFVAPLPSMIVYAAVRTSCRRPSSSSLVDPSAGRADDVEQGGPADRGRRPQGDLAVAVFADDSGVDAVHADAEALGEQVSQP